VSYTPRYTTPDQVRGQSLKLLGTAPDDALLPHIEAAEASIDNRLGTVYRLPLTAVTPIVGQIAAAHAAARAIGALYGNRGGRGEPDEATTLSQWAEAALRYTVENTTIPAELIPRPVAEVRPMLRTTTPAPSPMQDVLQDAFQYRPSYVGYPRRVN